MSTVEVKLNNKIIEVDSKQKISVAFADRSSTIITTNEYNPSIHTILGVFEDYEPMKKGAKMKGLYLLMLCCIIFGFAVGFLTGLNEGKQAVNIQETSLNYSEHDEAQLANKHAQAKAQIDILADMLKQGDEIIVEKIED